MSFKKNNQEPVAEAQAIPDDELALIRRRYHLTDDANATAWALYDRSVSVWRQRVAEWLTRLLTNPRSYVAELARRKTKRDHCEPSEGWIENQVEAAEVAQAQLLALAKPGQMPSGLALEILGEDGSPRATTLIRELCQAGWLPKPPECPRDGERRERERRAGITDEQRMANAESVF